MFVGILDSLILSASRTIDNRTISEKQTYSLTVFLVLMYVLLLERIEVIGGIMCVLWCSDFMCNLGKCDCEDFSFKITTSWRATQISNVGNKQNKGKAKSRPLTNIPDTCFYKVIPVSSERMCGPGPCLVFLGALRTFSGRVEPNMLRALSLPLNLSSLNFSF